MIPIFDIAYSSYKNSRLAPRSEKLPKKLVHSNDSSDDLTIAFIPTSVLGSDWLMRRILPRTGTAYVHPVSAMYHMQADVDETVLRLEKTYEEAVKDLRDNTNSRTRVRMLGVSLGTSLISRLVGELPCEELTLVVPGDRLGECAVESSLTGPTVRQSNSVEDYVDRLRLFDPIRYIDRIARNAGRVRIFRAGRDLLIPGYRGKMIADALQAAHPSVEVKTWEWADHFMGICLAAREISKLNLSGRSALYQNC